MRAWLFAAKERLWLSDEVMEPVVISSDNINDRRPVNLKLPSQQMDE